MFRLNISEIISQLLTVIHLVFRQHIVFTCQLQVTVGYYIFIINVSAETELPTNF